MQHKDRLSDEERKARRLESARKYREANREKAREASRLSQAKWREDPEVRARDKLHKQKLDYIERQRLYRLANKEKLIAQTMEWRKANPDKYEAYQRAYQTANRHRTIARLVKWRQENPERSHEYGRQWRKANPHMLVLKQSRRRARLKSVGGDLSPDIHKRLMALQKCQCAVCRTSLKDMRPHLDHHCAGSLGIHSGVESADAAGVLMGCLLLFDVSAQDVDWRTAAA